LLRSSSGRQTGAREHVLQSRSLSVTGGRSSERRNSRVRCLSLTQGPYRLPEMEWWRTDLSIKKSVVQKVQIIHVECSVLPPFHGGLNWLNDVPRLKPGATRFARSASESQGRSRSASQTQKHVRSASSTQRRARFASGIPYRYAVRSGVSAIRRECGGST